MAAKVRVTKTETIEGSVETGEVFKHTSSQTIENINNEVEPEFIKIYIRAINLIHGLKGKQADVLLALSARISYADKSQQIVVNKYIRKQIAGEVGCSVQYVADTITVLLKQGLIYRCGAENERTGVYWINPTYIARGKWSDIKELQIVFNEKVNNINEIELNILHKNNVIEKIEAPKKQSEKRLKNQIADIHPNTLPLFPVED